MIGDLSPAEGRTFTDPATGRTVTQLTGAPAHSYPLYYFVTSFTSDARYLVFHSERSGWVQLYRLDLETGEIGQLTDGRTWDSGWAIWCEWHLRGIYNHLSAIDPVADEVYYFQEDEIRATKVTTFANRLVAKLPPGRMSIGQAAFSPDGSLFGFIHVDAARYVALLRDREAREAMGQFQWTRDHHHGFRNAVPTTLSVLETATGRIRTVIETDFHFHHVLFIDNRTILLNHPRECAGMWTIGVDGGPTKHLRPSTAPGAHGAVNHQVVTRRGIVYEATGDAPGGRRETWFGRYDPATDTFEEGQLPIDDYVHAGFDPDGTFDFVEHAGERHELFAVQPAPDPGAPLGLKLLRTLRSPFHDHQRHHAHPFLSPDRRRLFLTDWDENGYSQVHALDVSDLTGSP